jgi:TatD DNase family protein
MQAIEIFAPLIDTHCHLTHRRFAEEAGEALGRAQAAGIVACVTIGTGADDALRARALAREHPAFLAATAGLDPFSAHAAGAAFDEELARLEAMLREGGFVAVGEIGLDYHYDLDPRPLQAQRFERQLDLAEDLGLPVVIHVRDAHQDLAAILAAHPRSRGVVHSFTAGPREAERYLALGWHLAFNGVATFKNAADVREAARLTPPDRVLLETDSPYLAPVPRRGERCEPAYVAFTAQRIAEARGEPLEALARVSTENARRLFGL